MKCDLALSAKCFLFLLFWAVAALAIMNLAAPRRMRVEPPNNNPQKFYLWSTGASVSHSFTYDPHAADVWLFRSGGGTMLGPVPLASITNMPTNGWRYK